MTSKQPPKVATWMLKHFGSGSDNDALLGDIAEQYRGKESVAWYWRQALSGIVVSFFKEIRGHKRIAAQALLAGWGMWTVYVTLVLGRLTPFFLKDSLGLSIQPTDPVGTAWSAFWAPVLIQANRAQPFSYVFAVALPFVVWTLSGWLVARLHREHQTGVVLLFAASILLMDLLLAGPFISRVGLPLAVLFAGRLAANTAAAVLGILIGGKLLVHGSESLN
jgi:hypothetical protein